MRIFHFWDFTTVVLYIIFLVGYLGSFTLLNNQIAQLDCLLSFAVAAVSAPRSYIRPQIFDEGHGLLELRELRHPCLELQEDVIYVANDAIFKKGKWEIYRMDLQPRNTFFFFF